MMNRYAQISAAGDVFAVSQLSGPIEAPDMIAIGPDDDVLGKRWDGGAWVVRVPTEAEAAAAALAEIDRRSGMSRLLRETLRAIAGQAAPATLVQYETDAAAHRAKLNK